MPIHDWTRVSSGTFHHFHQQWAVALCNALNAGQLPENCFAMVEQYVATAVRPQATYVLEAEEERYARMADRVAIHHGLGEVLAVIEIVSPGNKNSRHALRTFAEKAAELVRQGVNLLVVDLFPPGARDPQGIHPLVWDEITEQPFALPAGKPLTLVAYQCAPTKTAYVEPVAVGDRLPDMPLFLRDQWHVRAPLEQSYETAWNVMPPPIRRLVQPPV
jgi:hypothetical protein